VEDSFPVSFLFLFPSGQSLWPSWFRQGAKRETLVNALAKLEEKAVMVRQEGEFSFEMISKNREGRVNLRKVRRGI
jgi:hypothetical protein